MPDAPTASQADSRVLHALERHRRRREEQGIPTLTVLAGPLGRSQALFRGWLASRHQRLCTAVAATAAEAARAWLEALIRGTNLRAAAADFLGDTLGFAPGALRARLEGKTVYEQEVLLQELLPAAPLGDASSLCQLLLLSSGAPTAGPPFEPLLRACGGEPARVLAALYAIVSAGAAPALLLTGVGVDACERAARAAARLCEAVPMLPIALSAERAWVEAFLSGPESRSLAMVREGLVEVEAPSPQALRRRMAELGVSHTEQLEAPLAQLAADGASDELVTRFGRAAQAQEAAAREPSEASRARSAAEEFLHLLLEEIPETQGLFELNRRADFRINGRPVEVDFLSSPLRIAIEIDGYYHFRDMEAYRRDRRKDLALQRKGYWVLRFLAEDVVARFQEIRDTLLEVVAQRRDLSRRLPPLGEDADGGE